MSQENVRVVRSFLDHAQARRLRLDIDAVAVHLHQWGRGKGSGATVDLHFWEVWIVRDGRVVRVTHWVDKADALEAAWLSGSQK